MSTTDHAERALKACAAAWADTFAEAWPASSRKVARDAFQRDLEPRIRKAISESARFASPSDDPGASRDRRPYVGEGADGARRSAIIDREEVEQLLREDPRRERLLASARRWEEQAYRLDQQQAAAPTQEGTA